MIVRPYANVLLGLSIAFGLSCSLFASDAKLGENLRTHLADKSIKQADILIYLKSQADLSGAKSLKSKAEKGRFVVNALRQTAKTSQQSILKKLNKAGLTYDSYYIDNIIVVKDAPLQMIEELSADNEVARILHNPVVRMIPEATKDQLTSEEFFGTGDNIVSTGAERVWRELGNKGEGIVVAGQDTGIDWDHPALIRNYRGKTATGVDHNFNWHDAIRAPVAGGSNTCGYASTQPCDDHGHGTHTIGTAVGDDGAANQIGMAPGATWIGCRNMDNGLGRPSTYLECFQYFLAPWAYGADPASGDPEKAPDVINNSWGCPTSEGCNGTEFLAVINSLNAAGILTVAAAGNDGSSCSTIKDAPAHHTGEVLTVGAHDHRSGSIASFSSRGPSKFDGLTSPDFTAPGVSVRSAIPGGGYASAMWSGTSMASPHVAGAVALLWSKVPALKGDINGTVSRFKNTATAKTSTQNCGGVSGQTIPNNTFGHGHLNVYNAITAK
jgi:serine protease AprX